MRPAKGIKTSMDGKLARRNQFVSYEVGAELYISIFFSFAEFDAD
jgi:hypothetical protein